MVVLFTDGYGDNIHNVETEKVRRAFSHSCWDVALMLGVEQAAKIVMESEDTESGQMAPESSGEPEDAFQSESEGLAGGTRAPIGARPEPLSEEKKLERLAYMLCYLARMVSFSVSYGPLAFFGELARLNSMSGGPGDPV